MDNLEEALQSEGLEGLWASLRERRRLDERIIALESDLPEGATLPVPGDDSLHVAQQGSINLRSRGPIAVLRGLLGDGTNSVGLEEIGTFTLRPLR